MVVARSSYGFKVRGSSYLALSHKALASNCARTSCWRLFCRRHNRPGFWLCDSLLRARITQWAARHVDHPRMQLAYEAWHLIGQAHSIETWYDGELVGGLYGINMAACFLVSRCLAARMMLPKLPLCILSLFKTPRRRLDRLPNGN